MADFSIKLKPWHAPNYAVAQQPSPSFGDFDDVSGIHVSSLPQDTLDELAGEWLRELYSKAQKPSPWLQQIPWPSGPAAREADEEQQTQTPTADDSSNARRKRFPAISVGYDRLTIKLFCAFHDREALELVDRPWDPCAWQRVASAAREHFCERPPSAQREVHAPVHMEGNGGRD